MIMIEAFPPHTMTCDTCKDTFTPSPAKSGPHKGEYTDASLQRAADNHFTTCKGPKHEPKP